MATLEKDLLALEDALLGEPRCEDDHFTADGQMTVGCGVVASARLCFHCNGEMTLICQPLVDWLVTPPKALCNECDQVACLSIVAL